MVGFPPSRDETIIMFNSIISWIELNNTTFVVSTVFLTTAIVLLCCTTSLLCFSCRKIIRLFRGDSKPTESHILKDVEIELTNGTYYELGDNEEDEKKVATKYNHKEMKNDFGDRTKD